MHVREALYPELEPRGRGITWWLHTVTEYTDILLSYECFLEVFRSVFPHYNTATLQLFPPDAPPQTSPCPYLFFVYSFVLLKLVQVSAE